MREIAPAFHLRWLRRSLATPLPERNSTQNERAWGTRCPGVVTSLREGGDELLTFFRFPKAQWKTLRTTNVIERLHEEFRRRVKTQGSLPSEDAALVLLFSLVASGQIKLRRIDGWRKIAAVLSQHTVAA
ncbi:MAG TPA: transposase [Methylomirabilota bacterium]|jgi:transposase-like protein|nr:transposase [Methylomirabilota bacterium]